MLAQGGLLTVTPAISPWVGDAFYTFNSTHALSVPEPNDTDALPEMTRKRNMENLLCTGKLGTVR